MNMHQRTLRRMRAANILSLALCPLLLVMGCQSATGIRQEQLVGDNNIDIVVHLRDGSVITMDKGEYRVLPSDSGAVRGKGLRTANDFHGTVTRWEGMIPAGDIESITELALTPMGRAAVYGAIGASLIVGLFILFAFTHPKSMQ